MRVALGFVLAVVRVVCQRCFKDDVQDGLHPEHLSGFKSLIPHFDF